MALTTASQRHTYFMPRAARTARGRAAARPAAIQRAHARQAHRMAVAAGFGLLQLVTAIGFMLLMLLGLPGALG